MLWSLLLSSLITVILIGDERVREAMTGDGDEGRTPQRASRWTPSFSPLGSRVSDRVVIPPGSEYEVVRHALRAVDSVHGDGLLRRVRARRSYSRTEAAAYEWNPQNGQPLNLTFSARAPRPELSISHEIGHFLDQEGLGRGGQLGSESGEIPAIMEAIYASQPYRWLTTLTGRKQIRLRLPDLPVRRDHPQPRHPRIPVLWVRPQVLPVDASIVRYLREPGELFARAYAQLIATISQNPRFLAQLDEVLADPILGGVYHVQWGELDFVPIAQAFEQEWRARQWIA